MRYRAQVPVWPAACTEHPDTAHSAHRCWKGCCCLGCKHGFTQVRNEQSWALRTCGVNAGKEERRNLWQHLLVAQRQPCVTHPHMVGIEDMQHSLLNGPNQYGSPRPVSGFLMPNSRSAKLPGAQMIFLMCCSSPVFTSSCSSKCSGAVPVKTNAGFCIRRSQTGLLLYPNLMRIIE